MQKKGSQLRKAKPQEMIGTGILLRQKAIALQEARHTVEQLLPEEVSNENFGSPITTLSPRKRSG